MIFALKAPEDGDYDFTMRIYNSDGSGKLVEFDGGGCRLLHFSSLILHWLWEQNLKCAEMGLGATRNS